MIENGDATERFLGRCEVGSYTMDIDRIKRYKDKINVITERSKIISDAFVSIEKLLPEIAKFVGVTEQWMQKKQE